MSVILDIIKHILDDACTGHFQIISAGKLGKIMVMQLNSIKKLN